jgi:putative SOS response-associated peptidase YedK
MPVIVKPEDYELWLDPGFADMAALADCLKPFDPRLMKKYPVGTRVNRAANDDAECAREVPSVSAMPTLF